MSRSVLPLFLALSLWPLSSAMAQPWSVEQMMAGMARVRSERAYFEEEKHFSILQQPLKSTGRLAYRAPNYLLKETLTPTYERIEVEGEWLHGFDSDQSEQRVYLPRYPLLQALVEAVRSTMAGDLVRLASFYSVSFGGQAQGWTLRLTPLWPDVRQYLDRVVVSGRRDRIATVETVEADGNRSVMSVSIIAIDMK